MIQASLFMRLPANVNMLQDRGFAEDSCGNSQTVFFSVISGEMADLSPDCNEEDEGIIVEHITLAIGRVSIEILFDMLRDVISPF